MFCDRFWTTGWVDGSTGTLLLTLLEAQRTSTTIWTLPLLSTRQQTNSTSSPYSTHSPICLNSCLQGPDAFSWRQLQTAASTMWLSSDPTKSSLLCFSTGEFLTGNLSFKRSKATMALRHTGYQAPHSWTLGSQPARIFHGLVTWTKCPLSG